MHAGMPCTHTKRVHHTCACSLCVLFYTFHRHPRLMCANGWTKTCIWNLGKQRGGQPEDPLFYSILFRWCWPSRPRARSQTAGRSQAPTHSPTHGFSTPSHIVNARLRTQTYLVWVRGKRQTVLTVMRNTCDDAYLPVRREEATHPSRFEES